MSSRFTTTLQKAVPLYAQYTEAKYITDIPQSMWHSKRGEFSIGINPNLSWQNTLTYSKEKLYANGTVNTADYDKIGITTRVGKVTVFGGVDLCVDNGEKAIINTGSIRYTTGQITTTQRVGFKESKFLYSSSEVGIKTNSTNKLKYEATAAIEKRENMMYIPISNCLYYGSEPLDITLSERVTFIDKGEVTNFTTLGIKTFPVEWIQLGGAIDHLLVGLTTRRVGSNMDVAIRPVTFDKGAVFSSIQVEQEAETQRKYVDQSIDVYLLPHKRIEMLGSYANHYLSAWNKVSYSYLCCCTYNPIAGLLVRGGIENTGNMSAIGYRIGEGIEIFGGYRKRSELLPNYLSPPTSGQSSVFMDISVNKFIRFMNEQASHMLGGATGLNVILQPYTQEKYNVMIEAINDEGRIAQGYNSTCIIYDNTHKLVKEVKFDKKDKGRKELVIDVSPGHLPIVLEDKYKTGVVGASGVLGANYTPIKVKPKEEQKLSEKLSHFKVVVPKEATAGEMFGLKITAINTQGEKMESYMGTVKIVSTNEANVTPSTYQFTVKDQGEAYIWVFYPVAETINIIVIDKKNLTSIGTSGIINIK
ncbi:MAG: hypothetical protein HY769_02610 [Candidatus Stahlbacteria bacterium]|nr:hypothetical protein [Candidatus Stahlbacteria bacterium]